MQSRMNSILVIVAAAAVLVGLSGVAQAGLLAHWAFDETAGQTAYDSAGTHDGQLGSTAGPDSNDPAINQSGKIGTAYNFDGAAPPNADYVVVPSQADLSGMAKLTLTLWFTMPETLTADRHLIWKTGGHGNRSYWMGVGDAGTNFCATGQSLGDIKFAASEVTPGDAWHHLAAVYDGDTREWWFYLDGYQESYKDCGTGTLYVGSSTEDVVLGNHQSKNNAWKGGLDDIGILDEALGFGKVKSLYTTVTDAGLAYDLGKMYTLFDVYETGMPATIGSLTWSKVAGLAGGEGNAWMSGENYYVQLDASGNGVSTIPEPCTLALLAAGLLGLLAYAWRKRK